MDKNQFIGKVDGCVYVFILIFSCQFLGSAFRVKDIVFLAQFFIFICCWVKNFSSASNQRNEKSAFKMLQI